MAKINNYTPVLPKALAALLAILASTLIFAAFNLEKRVTFLEVDARSTHDIASSMDMKLDYILCKKFQEKSYCFK